MYAFSPHPSTLPQPNPPPSPIFTLPLDFVLVPFIVVPVIPSPPCTLPTPLPPAIVRLFLTSMSLVTFCLLFSSVDYVPVKSHFFFKYHLFSLCMNFSAHNFIHILNEPHVYLWTLFSLEVQCFFFNFAKIAATHEFLYVLYSSFIFICHLLRSQSNFKIQNSISSLPPQFLFVIIQILVYCSGPFSFSVYSEALFLIILLWKALSPECSTTPI